MYQAIPGDLRPDLDLNLRLWTEIFQQNAKSMVLDLVDFTKPGR